MTDVVLVSVDVEVDGATGELKRFNDTVQREAKETQASLKSMGDQAERSAIGTARAQRRLSTTTTSMGVKFRGAGAAVSAATGAVQVMGVSGGPLTTLGSSLAALAVSGTGPLALVVAGVTALSLVLADISADDGPMDKTAEKADVLATKLDAMVTALNASIAARVGAELGISSDAVSLGQTLGMREIELSQTQRSIAGARSNPRMGMSIDDLLTRETELESDIDKLRRALGALSSREDVERRAEIEDAARRLSPTPRASLLMDFASGASRRGSGTLPSGTGPITPEMEAVGRGIGEAALRSVLGDSQVSGARQVAFENRSTGPSLMDQFNARANGLGVQGQIDRARDEQAREAEARARAERDRLALSEEFRAPGRGFAQSVVSELSVAFSSGEFDNVLTTLQSRLTETFAEAALAGLAKGLGIEAAAANVTEGIGSFFSGSVGGPTSLPQGAR